MVRAVGGHYIAIHPGLLDDERFNTMDRDLFRPWLELFLQLDREPEQGAFKDAARAGYLLRHRGYGDEAATIVKRLRRNGWLVPGPGRALTMRGWREYAVRMDPETRPTTRAGRAEAGETPRKDTKVGGKRTTVPQRADDVPQRASVHNVPILSYTDVADAPALTNGRAPVSTYEIQPGDSPEIRSAKEQWNSMITDGTLKSKGH